VLGRSGRRAAGLLTLVASAVLVVLAVRFAGVAGPGPLDVRIDTIVQYRLAPYRPPLYEFVMLAGPASVAASLLLALGGLLLRNGRFAVIAVTGPALTALATLVLKPMIGRTLDGAYALPSGHTGGVVAAATVGALFVVRMVDRRRGLVALLSGAGVLAAAGGIALALVVNDLHYATDTAAGFCTAVAAVLGTALIVDSVAKRVTGDH
jgi:membrane-associated phospholipid phosphatase